MKSWIPIFAFCLFALSSCSKTEIASPAEEAISCNTTTNATVHKMVVNEDGSDFFYYLEFDQSAYTDWMVYPVGFPLKLQKEGMKVDVQFADTKKIYEYIVCLAGHQINPANPDIRTMPIVQVCSAEEGAF